MCRFFGHSHTWPICRKYGFTSQYTGCFKNEKNEKEVKEVKKERLCHSFTATILAEYLGLGEVLSVLREEERRDNVVKKIVQPI